MTTLKSNEAKTNLRNKYPKRLSLLIFLICVVIFRVIYAVVFICHQQRKYRKDGIQTDGLNRYHRSAWIKPNHSRLNQTLVDCKRVIDGDKREMFRALRKMKRRPKKVISPEHYTELTKSRHIFKKKRGYILKPLDKKEQDFPIAFCITIYKDVEQFERLLRAIYRPQNYYCIHIDKKSPEVFHRAVRSISDCFKNVFVASSLVDVRWGEFTVLQADLICMEDLWKRYKKWKYFINLTGQEFPLRTNSELVEILQNLSGRSIVKGSIPKERALLNRFRFIFNGTRKSKIRKKPFGRNMTLMKGSTHVVLSRALVNFIFQSQVASEFLEWVKDTGFPDETFVPSLYAYFNNVERPSQTSKKQYKAGTDNRKKWTPNTRYKNWGQFPCHGKIVRKICINGIGDLQRITTSRELFVNKFHLDYQYLALDCLEQWFYSKTLV